MDFSIDYSSIKFLLDVLQMLVTAAIALYLWQARKHTATNARVSELESDVALHGDRLSRIEVAMRGLPTHDDIGGVFQRISEVHGDVRQMRGSLEGLSRSVDLINQHLLGGGK